MKIKYRIKNFKSFGDSGEMDFAPITMLCGVNSVGKSSIIKSILLIKQSSIARRSSYTSSTPTQPLILNGELTKLGSWVDTITNKNRSACLSFSWAAVLKNSEYSDALAKASIAGARTKKVRKEHHVNLSIKLSSDPQKVEELSTQVDEWVLRIGDTNLIVTKSLKHSVDDESIYSVKIENVRAFLSRENSQIGRYALYLGDTLKALREGGDTIRLGNIAVSNNGPFFNSARLVVDDSWSDFFDAVYQSVDNHRGVKRGPRPKWIEQLQTAARVYRNSKTNEHRETSRSPTMRGLMFLAVEMVEEVTRCFLEGKAALAPMWRDIRYLGPLRDQPRRFYQFDDTGGADVGVSGEFTVQVLALEQNRIVSSGHVKRVTREKVVYSNQEAGTLLEHTNKWLSYMDLPRVTPSSLQQSLYKLDVGELEVALPDVGFGVSQVLPIIVEVLRAEPGDLVILEQPEIHLHPRVQAQLADFLLARSIDGIRFLVESHSEYLIKRLCRRMAESEGEELRRAVNIFFVEGKPGEATCNRVELNEFGEIENWPKGFFDLDEDVYWTKAALNRRKSNTLRKS